MDESVPLAMQEIKLCAVKASSMCQRGMRASVMGRRRKNKNSVEPPSESKRQKVARAELKRVEQFLRTATDVASARALSERERELVAEARRLRRQLYLRLGPKPPPAAKKAPHCGRPAPAGGIRSLVSGGLPGTGKHR